MKVATLKFFPVCQIRINIEVVSIDISIIGCTGHVLIRTELLEVHQISIRKILIKAILAVTPTLTVGVEKPLLSWREYHSYKGTVPMLPYLQVLPLQFMLPFPATIGDITH